MNNGQVPALGETLRQLRLRAGYSQETLAERAGVSVRAVSDLERGTRTTARFETIRLLAKGLELDQEGLAGLLAARNGSTVIVAPFVSLPVPVTSFIGRSNEIARIVALIDDEGRLVTLTGTGGVGKTRIAIQVAHSVATRFADGVVFVNLAPVTSVPEVIPTIAASLGIPTQPAQRDVDVLIAALDRRRMLLVLDNLEHVIDCAADLARLLEACPHLKILATSRVVLRLAAEQVVCIEPMELPSDDGSCGDAVELFIARATASDSTFIPKPAEDAAIVRKLEGVPLSIELAASRVRYTSRADLLDQLDAQLPVLISRVVDQTQRHRSIRDTIAWSYHLLSGEAQRTMRLLSVFPAGCTLETARLLFGQDNALVELIDSSLVRQRVGVDGRARYTMLQVIHEYALEQLQVTEEEDFARRTIHTCWAMPLAKSGENRLWYPDAHQVFQTLDAEAPNLTMHLHWLIEREQIEDAMLISNWLTAWRFIAGRHEYVRQELEYLLAHPAGSEISTGRVSAMASLGIALTELGEASAAVSVLTQAAEMAEAIGDRIYLADALVSQGEPLCQLGYLDTAEQRIREGLAVAQENGQQTFVAICIRELGQVAMRRQQWPLAREYCERSLESHTRNGTLWIVMRTTLLLTQIALELDAIDEAERHAQAALMYIRELNNRRDLPTVYHLLATIARRCGQTDEAKALLSTALDAAREIGNMGRMADIHLDMALLADDPAVAREHFRQALRWYERCGDQKGKQKAQDHLANGM